LGSRKRRFNATGTTGDERDATGTANATGGTTGGEGCHIAIGTATGGEADLSGSLAAV
jgi:hypothetical protein